MQLVIDCFNVKLHRFSSLFPTAWAWLVINKGNAIRSTEKSRRSTKCNIRTLTELIQKELKWINDKSLAPCHERIRLDSAEWILTRGRYSSLFEDNVFFWNRRAILILSKNGLYYCSSGIVECPTLSVFLIRIAGQLADSVLTLVTAHTHLAIRITVPGRVLQTY